MKESTMNEDQRGQAFAEAIHKAVLAYGPRHIRSPREAISVAEAMTGKAIDWTRDFNARRDVRPGRFTPFTAAVDKMHTDFMARLDQELIDAYAQGLNLAVSSMSWSSVGAGVNGDANRAQVDFIRLLPGQEPPAGRGWVVYRTAPQPVNEGVGEMVSAEQYLRRLFR
jgi:hypothetical protein